MKNKDRFTLYENNDEFNYDKDNNNINIKFNRVAFIFFVFFIISLIYTIHLTHLGSRNSTDIINKKLKVYKLKRSDIIDRNGTFLAKTVSSIDIGINPIEIINQKKTITKLRLYFSK